MGKVPSGKAERQALTTEATETVAPAKTSRVPKEPVPGPRPGDQVNWTDEESRIMPVSGGGYEQCYHAQAALRRDANHRLHHRRRRHARDPLALGRADVTAAYRAGPGPAALGDGRCRPGRVRPASSTGTGLPIRSAHRLVKAARRRSDRARRGPLAPWVAAAASSATAATHGHPRAAILARFSGSVGTLSPNHDCCQGLSEPGTLAEVALDLLSLMITADICFAHFDIRFSTGPS